MPHEVAIQPGGRWNAVPVEEGNDIGGDLGCGEVPHTRQTETVALLTDEAKIEPVTVSIDDLGDVFVATVVGNDHAEVAHRLGDEAGKDVLEQDAAVVDRNDHRCRDVITRFPVHRRAIVVAGSNEGLGPPHLAILCPSGKTR